MLSFYFKALVPLKETLLVAVVGHLRDPTNRPSWRLRAAVDGCSENPLHTGAWGLEGPSVFGETMMLRENGHVEEDECTNAFWNSFMGSWQKISGYFLVNEKVVSQNASLLNITVDLGLPSDHI